MKRITIPLAFVLLFASFFLACGPDTPEGTQGRAANGPVKYGGVFRMNETEEFRTLYPLNIVEEVGYHIGAQVYEGLVKFNQSDMKVKPALAYRWETLDSATRFVFHLRKEVVFHDDACFDKGKGREFKASDVKYCFDKLCAATANNQQYSNTFKDRVVGANEYYESTEKKAPLASGVSGVKAIDDSTIEIKLIRPMPNFLSVLSSQAAGSMRRKLLQNTATICVRIV